MEKKLHPSVEQFKEFVKKNPHLIKEVREGTNTWQDLYEEWLLLGEDDSRWSSSDSVGNNTKSKESEKETSDFIAQLWNGIKKMDTNTIQNHLSSLSEAVGTIQGVLSQFQGNKGRQKTTNQAPPNPFSFRKD